MSFDYIVELRPSNPKSKELIRPNSRVYEYSSDEETLEAIAETFRKETGKLATFEYRIGHRPGQTTMGIGRADEGLWFLLKFVKLSPERFAEHLKSTYTEQKLFNIGDVYEVNRVREF